MSAFMQQVRGHLGKLKNVQYIDYIKQRTPLGEIVRVNKLAKAIVIGSNSGSGIQGDVKKK